MCVIFVLFIFRYMRDIKEFEAKLRWFVGVDVQVNQLADIKEVEAKMSEISTKFDEIMTQPTEAKPKFDITWAGVQENRTKAMRSDLRSTVMILDVPIVSNHSYIYVLI